MHATPTARPNQNRLKCSSGTLSHGATSGQTGQASSAAPAALVDEEKLRSPKPGHAGQAGQAGSTTPASEGHVNCGQAGHAGAAGHRERYDTKMASPVRNVHRTRWTATASSPWSIALPRDQRAALY